MKDLFNIFRTADTIGVEDLADYQVILLDTMDEKPAIMATTALTIYQLEHGYDRGRFQMLLWAMSKHCSIHVRIRAMVDLLLVCSRQNVTDEWALEQMAELLSYEHRLAFDAWCSILQSFNPEKYDPNYAILRSMYNVAPFKNSPELFFQPFERGEVENLDDYEWKVLELFLEAMNLCDSDKYLLTSFMKQYLPMIVQQLKEQDVDLESLDEINLNFQRMMMISNGEDHLQPRKYELDPIENYVQQFYRFIDASHQTSLHLTEDANQLIETMIGKMVVVGAKEIDTIEAIWE